MLFCPGARKSCHGECLWAWWWVLCELVVMPKKRRNERLEWRFCSNAGRLKKAGSAFWGRVWFEASWVPRTLVFLVPTWRIIPASKWLVTSIYKPFRPFVRAFLRDLLTMAINHFMVNSNGVSSPSFWNFLTPEMLVVSSSLIYPSYYWSSKKSCTSGYVGFFHDLQSWKHPNGG